MHKINNGRKDKKKKKMPGRNNLPKNGDVGYNGPLCADVAPTPVIFCWYCCCCWMVGDGFWFGFWNGENAVATKVKKEKEKKNLYISLNESILIR